ncbi:MAG: hypothetical protein KC496_05860 [Anaerolineae bacterium]|nr:hypothetical protein [Anaerolineae bacterium]
MQTVSNTKTDTTPEAEIFSEYDDTAAWLEDEDDTMPYAPVDRSRQLLRLILLLMLIIAAAAFVVFVLLPSIDSLFNPAPLPPLQPPVQV